MSQLLLRRLFPRDLHHVAGLHQLIVRSLPERGRVLDLGCGDNRELGRYRTEEREVWGTDFQAHPELQDAAWFRLLERNGKVPFDDASFDAVVTVMVLEHIVEPGPFFAEVARVLRPGGHFIGHSISGIHYVTFLRRLVGLLPHSVNQMLVKALYHRAEVDTFPAYYRLNRLGQLRRHSLAAGLQPTHIQRYADPGYFHFAAPLEAIAILGDRLMEAVAPGCGRLYFTWVARKEGARQSAS